MAPILVAAVFAGLLLLVIFAALLRRAVTNTAAGEGDDADWLDSFTIDRYRPMERLLSEGDFEFLAAQPGYDPDLARELRADRRRVFRMYLRNLAGDFKRLHRIARALIMYSPEDRPDLARTLVRQQWNFECAMMAVRFRLALHAHGLSRVDVRGVLGALDHLNAQVRQPALSVSKA